MAFTEAFSNDIANVGAGERYGTGNVELNTTVFEDEIVVGRFAKLDTGSIDKLDGSATPTIAGVVIRNVASDLEDGDTVDAAIYNQIDYVHSGLVTVAVKSGETPTLLERVYVSNDGDASDGLATATNTDTPVNAEFIKEIKSGVWLIYITPPQGDVSTHIGDAVGAHAASAISLLDSGAFTTAIEVEAALAELFPKAPVAIADPSDAGALTANRSATIALTSTGVVDTRTLAIPSIAGITLLLSFDVDGGDLAVTAASGINVAGNTVMTFDTAGEYIKLEAAQVAGVLAWRVVANDGVTLS